MSDTPMIRLGTRRSPLAMAQAEETRSRLCAAHGWDESAVELVPVVASGDKVLDRPLAEIGGKALWTRELDAWLGEGRIDAAVHSMKDVETLRPDEFAIAAILPRADRRDVLVGAESLDAIPAGAVLGTSAPRRAAQMLSLRPDLKVVTFRGNVATRLAKLEAGEADVTLLAKAGLDRLGEELGAVLDSETFLPAPAQGAIGIECLVSNARACEMLAAIDHAPSHAEVLAERALLKGLGGTCHSPVAVECLWQDEGTMAMRAAIFSADGAEKVTGTAQFAPDAKYAPAHLATDLLEEASAAIADLFDPPTGADR